MSLKDWKLLSNVCWGIIILQFVYLFFIDGNTVFDAELFSWLVPLNILLFNPILIVDIKNRKSKDYTDRYYSTPSASLFLLICLDLFGLIWLFTDF